MKRILYLTVITLILLLQTWSAAAACSTITIYTPDGKLIVCTQCCSGDTCTINCLGA